MHNTVELRTQAIFSPAYKGYSTVLVKRCTCGLKVSVSSPNVKVVNLSISCGHHFTGRAVGLIHTNFSWEGLANWEVNCATSDISRSVALWYDAFLSPKSYIPVPGAVACTEREREVKIIIMDSTKFYEHTHSARRDQSRPEHTDRRLEQARLAAKREQSNTLAEATLP